MKLRFSQAHHSWIEVSPSREFLQLLDKPVVLKDCVFLVEPWFSNKRCKSRPMLGFIQGLLAPSEGEPNEAFLSSDKQTRIWFNGREWRTNRSVFKETKGLVVLTPNGHSFLVGVEK